MMMYLIYIIALLFCCDFNTGLTYIQSKDYAFEDSNLNRGVTAVRADSATVFLSWRFLNQDPENISFDVYRDGRKITRKPFAGATCFTDKITGEHRYSVLPSGRKRTDNNLQSTEIWSQGYLRIPLNRPAGGELGGRQFSYSPGDASVADLDGDGAFEIVLKWDPSNARDNSQDGFTSPVIIDAYRLDGTQLWRIDLGRNIRAGAHYTQLLVYDFDGNGKAELICKTADGTIDGKGKVIGPSTAYYVNGRGRILSGPEYLTVFEGLTGKEVSTVGYIPGRGDVCGWGNNECIGNRSDRFLACVAYLDGILPSAVFCRGYYARLTICAWDFSNGKLSQRWLFDTEQGFPQYMGQGNHNLSVGDIDSDGRDEIVYGSSAYDDNGKPLYTTGMGHGDAMHLADIDPDNPGLEVWAVKETGGWGSVLHSAVDGKTLFRIPDSIDVGRGIAADIYPEHRGYELWSSATNGIYNIKGEKISTARPSVNFRIYWDGDLQDELLDRTFIDDWDHINHKPVRLLDASKYGGQSINGTKATPVISADILGDWREEVIFRGADNESLLLFSTSIPTEYRIRTLMSDHIYRMGVAWQNVVYNQPPHPGYYLPDAVVQ